MKDAEADPAETPKGKQVRLRNMYPDIREQIHGPDFRAQALLQNRAPEANLGATTVSGSSGNTLGLLDANGEEQGTTRGAEQGAR